MDSFGLDDSLLIGLQLNQFLIQFKHSCSRLNIITNVEKPVKHWLMENLRGEFKTRNARTGFKFAKRYNMMWELKLERNDVKFCVEYDNEVFEAIEPFFRIVEMDREIIVGNCDSYSVIPLPAIKNVSFVCEDISVSVNGLLKKTMPDIHGFLTFNDEAQQANWALNITPIVQAVRHSPTPSVTAASLSPSPSVAAPRFQSQHSGASIHPHGQPSTGRADIMGMFAPPASRTVNHRGTPELHSVVEQTIRKHNQLQRLPCDVSKPPPAMYSTAVQAGQPGGSAEQTGQPVSSAGQAGNLMGDTVLQTKGRRMILPTDDSSCSEISLFAKSNKKGKKKKVSKPSTSTPRKRPNNDRDVHVYDSISSESDAEKFARETNIFFQTALQGRENDPLTTFLQSTVPRVFSFLSLKEKSLNSSEQQAREKIITEEIDKIYQTTKEAIVGDTTIRAEILTSAPQDRSNEESTLQNEEPQERITRSKSKTNVSIESSEENQ